MDELSIRVENAIDNHAASLDGQIGGQMPRQFAVKKISFVTSRFQESLDVDNPRSDVRWIPNLDGTLEDLYLYLPDAAFSASNHPDLKIFDTFVESSPYHDSGRAQIFPNDVSQEAVWESAEAEYGAGWYRISNLGEPWVLQGSSYRIQITRPTGVDMTVPYMWPRDSYVPYQEALGFESVIGWQGMPIIKTKIIQRAHTLAPTEMYGDHIWPGILEPYEPSYAVLLESLRVNYKRFVIDYSRYGEEWSGLTVPVTFQSNQFGGGMFSYMLSQQITPTMLNHSFLTCYLLLNVMLGQLTSFYQGKYEIVGEVTRDVNAYDRLYYDKMNYWNIPLWDQYDVDSLEGIDADGDGTIDGDPKSTAILPASEGSSGHAGADWYTSYEDIVGYETDQPFASELLLRMPTIEPWDWEVSDETGTLVRCPKVDLEEINLDVLITESLRNHLIEINSDILYIRLEMNTLQGKWMDTTTAAQLPEGPNVPIKISFNFNDLALWDAKAFKEDQRRYQENVRSAPYVIVEIYDSDPSQFYQDTDTRLFQISSSSDIQLNTHANYINEIKDAQLRTQFRQEHLLDSEMIGMNARFDRDYSEYYNQKIRQYNEWVNATIKLQEQFTPEEAVRVIIGACSLVLSIYTMGVSGISYSAIVGATFALDQIQAVFTHQSIFSRLVGEYIVYPITGTWGISEERRREAVNRFNLWAPFTNRQSMLNDIGNSMWSTLLTFSILQGPALIKLGLTKAGILQPSPPDRLQSIRQNWEMGKEISKEDILYAFKYTKLTSGKFWSMLQIEAAKLQAVEIGSQFIGPNSIYAVPSYLATLDEVPIQIAKQYLQEIGFLSTWKRIFYQTVYAIKQVFTGLLSPTEWFELGYFLTHGYTQLEFSGNWQMIWNWGDNALFLPLQDETTWGFFKFLYWNAMGQPHLGLK